MDVFPLEEFALTLDAYLLLPYMTFLILVRFTIYGVILVYNADKSRISILQHYRIFKRNKSIKCYSRKSVLTFSMFLEVFGDFLNSIY